MSFYSSEDPAIICSQPQSHKNGVCLISFGRVYVKIYQCVNIMSGHSFNLPQVTRLK